jgi:hypothetical protein
MSSIRSPRAPTHPAAFKLADFVGFPYPDEAYAAVRFLETPANTDRATVRRNNSSTRRSRQSARGHVLNR